MQDAKEDVRARLNIEDVIGEYVQLKRAGRNFKGLSPFTSEKTPSFFVSPDKHIWHDFSSNKGGDIFSFIMEVEGLDFRAALEHLARKAGVDLSIYENQSGQAASKLKKRLLNALDLAANYYQQSLVKNPHAIEYVFKKRGLSKEIVADFRIGYAPNVGDALVNFLTKKGYSTKELSQAGLTNRFGGDLFRGRMTVPLMDATGRIIGFTGRLIEDIPNSPKYLNTPQTLLYDKSRHVFGLSQAKEAIRTNGYSVIVEGNLDVVSSHQIGIKQVVATAGTAMTEYHLKALSRLSNQIRLSFDGDRAGCAATERAIPIAQRVGVELTIINLFDGAKDPDELIKKDPTLWAKAVDSAEPAIDWLIKQYAGRDDLATAAGKRRFTTASLEIVRQITDSVEREHYITRIAKYSDTSVEALKEKLEGWGEIKPKLYKKIAQHENIKLDDNAYQDNLLAVALIDGAVHELFKDFDISAFVGEQRQAVARYLSTSSGQSVIETPKQLQKHDIYVKILLLKADTRYADWNAQDRYQETARLLRQVTTESKKQQKDRLTDRLRDAETLGDEALANEIRTQINNLIKEMQSVQR